MSFEYVLTRDQQERYKHRSIENEKLGITKGYSVRYNCNDTKNELLNCYYAICGYSSNEYSFVYNHVTVNKCMKCRRLLGLSKSQVTNRREVLLYFLLDKEITNFGKNGTWGIYNISKYNEYRNTFKPYDFALLKHGNSNIVAVRKGNIIYRNYEYQNMVGSMFGSHDNSFRDWDYIDTAKQLGLFDIKICDIPLDTINTIAYNINSMITDIEIIEPNQDQYETYGGDEAHKKEKRQYMEDQFFKVTFENLETKEKVVKAYIWQFDETAKCLIEVSNECKNHQEGLLFLYPKTIKNRSGTKRQGEFFFEPTDRKFKKSLIELRNPKAYKHYIHNIKDRERSNHYATRTVYSEDIKDFLTQQYVTGTIRHNNRDHRMLKLKKGIWYKVHQSNSINSWSIDLRRGAGAD